MSADEKHPGCGNITFDFMVSELAGHVVMSLLTSLTVSIVIGLEFIVACTLQAAYVMIRYIKLSHVS